MVRIFNNPLPIIFTLILLYFFLALPDFPESDTEFEEEKEEEDGNVVSKITEDLGDIKV